MRKLLTLLTAAVAAAGCGRADPGRSYYAPEAYTRRANDFVARGLLTADCSGDSVRLRPQLRQASREERSWYDDSYLSADVDRFNRDPQGFAWLFAVDELCRLQGVNIAAHTVRLPFAADTPWLGTVFYGGDPADAVLRSSRREVAIRAANSPLAEDRLGESYVGAPDTMVATGGVRMNFTPRGIPAADLFVVGKSVVLQSRTGTGGIRVMGNMLPDSRIVRLESGDWVSFQAPTGDEETFVLQGERALRQASYVRRRNASLTRITDDPGLGRYVGTQPDEGLTFLELLPRTLDASLLVLGRRAVGEFDVQLTLDRQLQSRIDRTFHTFVREVQGRQPSSSPIAAGVTVMNGRDGSILALGTFPHPAEVDGDSLLDPDARRRLLMNQNFLLHPIGSAGKPFLLAAILDRHPDLLSLALPPHPDEVDTPRRQVLQCELPAGYEVHGSSTPVDVATALEISSNRFVVELAVLALAESQGGGLLPDRSVDWPGPAGGTEMQLNGAPLTFGPSLERYLVDTLRVGAGGLPQTRPCTRLNRLEQAPFALRLEDITGASTYQGLRPMAGEHASGEQTYQRYTTGRYDLRLWRPLLDRLLDGTSREADWSVRAAFQRPSPERVNLGFNRIREFRQDYVTFVLGGGRSAWSNVQLAEAMSRLVTDRKVEPQLLSAVLPRDSGAAGPVAGASAAADPLALAPEVRAAVLSGLIRVVEGDRGTAALLAPRLRALRAAFPGDRIVLFAKTGSPRLVRTVPREVQRPFTDMVARGRLALENGALVARAAGTQVPYARPEAPGRTRFEAALGQGLREVGVQRNSIGVRAVILLAVDHLVEQVADGVPPADFVGPLRMGSRGLELDRADEFFTHRLIRSPGATLVFSLVRVPGPGAAIPSPAELNDPRTRVITVAIHLAAGPDSRVAVEAADRILPELESLLRD